MSNDNLLYDECEKIIKAIDTINDFLIKYSEFWSEITWHSNIDGHELYVDWGYFEEGMREIKNYCKRLNGQK